MKIKEITTASVLVAALIAQNYILYAFPITLTYLFIYLITKTIKSSTVVMLSLITFIAIKNIIYMTFPTVILADIVGLVFVTLIFKIKIKWLRYILIPIIIIVHILLLDFATVVVLMGDNLLIGMIGSLTTGFITYIYAPLSVILIIIFDGLEFISSLSE